MFTEMSTDTITLETSLELGKAKTRRDGSDNGVCNKNLASPMAGATN